MVRVLYINLQHRVDRNDKMLSRLSKIASFSVERVEAIAKAETPKKFGEKAFATEDSIAQAQLATIRSHKKAIQLAIDREYTEVLILEDDVIFTSDFDRKLDMVLNELPSDWDILYLGVTPSGHPRRKINKFLSKTTNDLGCWAMLIRDTVMQSIIDLYDAELRPTDEMLAWRFQRQHNCYVTNSFLCKVEDDYSDIVKKYRSREELAMISINYID